MQLYTIDKSLSGLKETLFRNDVHHEEKSRHVRNQSDETMSEIVMFCLRLIMLVTPQHTQFSSQEIIKKSRDWRWRHCCLSWREELNSCFSHSCFHQHWAPPTISLTSRDLSLQVCDINFQKYFQIFCYFRM